MQLLTKTTKQPLEGKKINLPRGQFRKTTVIQKPNRVIEQTRKVTTDLLTKKTPRVEHSQKDKPKTKNEILH